MSSKTGQVKVAGRFPAGERVALVKVDGPHVLRAHGGQTLERKKVDDDGVVEFTKDVEIGARYFVVGYRDGNPVEVRCTGVDKDAPTELAQPPITYEPRKFASGEAIPTANEVSAAADAAAVDVSSSKPAAKKRPARRRSSSSSSSRSKSSTSKPRASAASKK